MVKDYPDDDNLYFLAGFAMQRWKQRCVVQNRVHSRSSYAFLIFLLHLGAHRAWEWLCFFNWLIKSEASPSCPELSQLWLESIICRTLFFRIKKAGRWQCTHKNIIKLMCWSGSSYTWPWHIPSEHTGDPAPRTPSAALQWWKWQQQSGQYKHPGNPGRRDRETKRKNMQQAEHFFTCGAVLFYQELLYNDI